MKKKTFSKVVMLLSVSVLLMTGCATERDVKAELLQQQSPQSQLEEEEQTEQPTEDEDVILSESISELEPEQEPEPELEPDRYATIVSFGDALCHKPVDDAAYDKETGEYDFSYMFKYMGRFFSSDYSFVIGNCESPMAGAEKGYSGYPNFNAPEHLAIDLKELGVDIMTTANNHCMDKGVSGLVSTLDFLDDAGIDHVGTARSKEEQDTILIKDLNGIKTAFLAYTYGTNGIQVPAGKEFSVNLIDEELMLKQINQAKEEGADLIVASMHWGIEYQTEPNAEQKRLAEFLIKNDVKVILGCHPHVLQPMQMITVTDDGEEKEGLCVYSQGNFFSNQPYENTQNTAIFNIGIEKSGETGEVTIKSAGYAPVYVYRKPAGSKDRYELLDLTEIIRSYEANEGEWTEDFYKLALKEKERCCNIIGPEIYR